MFGTKLKRDRKAVYQAIERYGDMVYRLAFRVLRNPHDAEDVAQDVFLKLLKARRHSVPVVHHPRAYLAITTLNTARNILRRDENRRRREEASAFPISRSGVSNADGEAVQREEVWHAVEALPDELKIPVILHYQERCKYREIAEALGCPEGTVATRIANAKARLKSVLQKSGVFAVMPNFERFLRTGDIPSPPNLQQTLKAAVDRELATTAGNTTVAKGSASALGGVVAAAVVLSAAAWITAVGFPWSGSDAPPEELPASRAADHPKEVVPPEIQGEGPAAVAPSPRNPGSDRVGADSPGNPGGIESSALRPAIYGWLTDGEGTPLAHAEVRIRMKFSSDLPKTRVHTNAAGYYEASLEMIGRRALATLDSPAGENEEVAGLLERKKDSEKRASAKKLTHVVESFLAAAQEGLVDVTADERWVPRENREHVIVATVEKRKKAQESSLEWAKKPARQELEEHLERSWAFGVNARHDVRFGPSLTFVVTAFSEGYQPQEVSLSLEGNERVRLDLALDAAETLHGVVLGPNGEALDATVDLRVHPGESLPAEITTVASDASGAFEFASLPPGTHLARASAPGFQSLDLAARTGGPGVVFRLSTAAVLRATVRGRDGQPQEGAKLQLTQEGEVVATARADADGRATFDDLRAGEVALSVLVGPSPYPFVEEFVRLREGVVEEREIVTPEAIALSGRVLFEDLRREGEAQRRGAMVLVFRPGAGSSSTRSPAERLDGEGEFEFRLPPGEYVLGVATLRDEAWSLRMLENLVLSPGEGARDVTLRFRPATFGSFILDVHDPAGAPIAHAGVTMIRTRTGSEATRFGAADGTFRIALHPDRFQLDIGAEGYRKRSVGAVDLGPGEERRLRVTLDPLPDLSGLSSLLDELPAVTVRDGTTLKGFFAWLDHVSPGIVAIAPGLEDALERILMTKGGRGELAEILPRILRSHGLVWELDGGLLRIVGLTR